MMSNPNTTSRLTQAEQVLRSSLEYSAAFDLEVWKAQQQTLFREQLAKAKRKLEQKIRQQVEGEQAEVMQQLEMTRAQLEQAAATLQEAQREQLRRSEGLDAREQAMEERRQRLAAQHEQHISRLEDENKRERERHRLVVEALENQLREKDRNALVLQDRLRAAEEAFETLRRRVSRYQLSFPSDGEDEAEEEEGEDLADPDQDDTTATMAGRSAAVRRGAAARRRPDGRMASNRRMDQQAHRQRLEDELVFAHATVRELNTSLRSQRDLLSAHERAKEEMTVALRQREEQMVRLAKKCHSLQEALQERERAYVEEKRKELLGRERALEMRQVALERGGGAMVVASPSGYEYDRTRGVTATARTSWVPGPSRGDLVGAYARKPVVPTVVEGPASIVDLIAGLREEVAARLHHHDSAGAAAKNPEERKKKPAAQRGRGRVIRRTAGPVPSPVAGPPPFEDEEAEWDSQGWEEAAAEEKGRGARDGANRHDGWDESAGGAYHPSGSGSISTITPRPVGGTSASASAGVGGAVGQGHRRRDAAASKADAYDYGDGETSSVEAEVNTERGTRNRCAPRNPYHDIGEETDDNDAWRYDGTEEEHTRDEESLLLHLDHHGGQEEGRRPATSPSGSAAHHRPPTIPVAARREGGGPPPPAAACPSSSGRVGTASSVGGTSRYSTTSTSNSAISVPVARMGGLNYHQQPQHASAIADPSSTAMRTTSASGSGVVVTPLPNEFNSASTISGEKAKTAREEMEQFVQQLQLNRERLLETKVYTEEHPVIQEMTTKLELYQQYLREGVEGDSTVTPSPSQ